MDWGERVEEAAIREAKEETGLDVKLKDLLYVYSDPKRDPRFHTITTVFIAEAQGTPRGMDDAEKAKVFGIEKIPFDELVFDHAKILKDYLLYLKGERPRPFA